jgi:hypothetical protein
MRRDPFHGPLPSFFLAVARFMLVEYVEAARIARDFVAQAPMRPWGHALLAMIHAELGQGEKALAEAAEVLRLDPAFTVSGTAIEKVAWAMAATAGQAGKWSQRSTVNRAPDIATRMP